MPSSDAPGDCSRDTVRLRPVERADIPAMFEMQLDPESNRMAMVKPRDWPTFQSVWEEIFTEPGGTVPRLIVAGCDGGPILGIISCFQRDGLDYIGYWIAREHWGKGLATRALALLLKEVTRRPLHARVAATNGASLRVLTRCGFIEQQRCHSPETERFLECEEVILMLR